MLPNFSSDDGTSATKDIQWLVELDKNPPEHSTEGLVYVPATLPATLPPEEYVMLEKAKHYGATAVFFEASRNGRPRVAQAFVYVAGPSESPDDFAELHRRLWSWGGVPLVYRKTSGLIQLFRCVHKPDFIGGNRETICNPHDTLNLAAEITKDLTSKPWWNSSHLVTGTLWDDPAACNALMSSKEAAHKAIIDAIKRLNSNLNARTILKKHLRRRLLIVSLLIAYLEARGVLQPNFFGEYLAGATKFFQVLSNGEALVAMLGALEQRFNGHVFVLDDSDRDSLRNSSQLPNFARLIEAREEKDGQLNLWDLYSFKDLPVELISHIYQLFVEDPDSSVYTPPFLVKLMLDEALGFDRLDRLHRQSEVILDPCCGSGIFLVEAYKRLVIHWRCQNNWRRPGQRILKNLLRAVHGVDKDKGAVELTAFSLCLALCDALEPEEIRSSVKLFPILEGETLHHSCFFDAAESGLIDASIGIILGNPPFKSELSTPGASRSYDEYVAVHGGLPDKQLAYLFLHESMNMVANGGLLCMLQKYNFLYNPKSLEFRNKFLADWDVREVLDFVSVRGLFKKGDADTKVVVLIVEASTPPTDRRILHATFRRSGRVEAQQGFDIDYYDMHYVPQRLALDNDSIWRSNLLGGGRVLAFIDRLKNFRTLGQYAESQGWTFGEGFIEGKQGMTQPAGHIVGQPLLPSVALTNDGIQENQITTACDKPIEGPRSRDLFSPPMLLVREQMDIPHAIWTKSYLTYKNQVVGFATKKKQLPELLDVDRWLRSESTPLRAFVAVISGRLFTQKSTTLSEADILALPYPDDLSLDISPNEALLVDDIVDYYRDLVLHGEKSQVLRRTADLGLNAFTEIFTRQINAIYKKTPVRPLKEYSCSGVICQPFVFGDGEVDWQNGEQLSAKLDNLMFEQHSPSLAVTRIARIYDGNFIFLIKPDRLRYWLRSIALRDADEVLFDLRSQGF